MLDMTEIKSVITLTGDTQLGTFRKKDGWIAYRAILELARLPYQLMVDFHAFHPGCRSDETLKWWPLELGSWTGM